MSFLCNFKKSEIFSNFHQFSKNTLKIETKTDVMCVW